MLSGILQIFRKGGKGCPPHQDSPDVNGPKQEGRAAGEHGKVLRTLPHVCVGFFSDTSWVSCSAAQF